MTALKAAFCSTLVLSLALPASVFAQSATLQSQLAQSLKSNRISNATFYRDPSKQSAITPTDIAAQGATEVYVVTPFNQNIHTSLGIYSKTSASADGNMVVGIKVYNDSTGTVLATNSIELKSGDATQNQLVMDRSIKITYEKAVKRALAEFKAAHPDSLMARVGHALIPNAQADIDLGGLKDFSFVFYLLILGSAFAILERGGKIMDAKNSKSLGLNLVKAAIAGAVGLGAYLLLQKIDKDARAAGKHVDSLLD